MTLAQKCYERAGIQVRIARAKLLLDLACKVGPDGVAFLMDFARDLGDECSADSIAAFRAAQEHHLRTAEAELGRLRKVTG